ncbi:hypothetical protein [Paraburkholderia saeva]|uniref:Uncharacterized protein n=1 Tax=Paraburkholderia saeva TaxID=2777537 RepID=A0A9N8RXS9_9BURK|nr:hypothetical protein [Paraburkholderia saeva]CAG4900564.1 hypothetical protein LMG31841_02892 [Paraburkholderia saeva]
MTFHRLHTVLVLLSNAYLEIACHDMEQPELKRHWVIRRTVDLKHVCWC